MRRLYRLTALLKRTAKAAAAELRGDPREADRLRAQVRELEGHIKDARQALGRVTYEARDLSERLDHSEEKNAEREKVLAAVRDDLRSAKNHILALEQSAASWANVAGELEVNLAQAEEKVRATAASYLASKDRTRALEEVVAVVRTAVSA